MLAFRVGFHSRGLSSYAVSFGQVALPEMIKVFQLKNLMDSFILKPQVAFVRPVVRVVAD